MQAPPPKKKKRKIRRAAPKTKLPNEDASVGGTATSTARRNSASTSAAKPSAATAATAAAAAAAAAAGNTRGNNTAGPVSKKKPLEWSKVEFEQWKRCPSMSALVKDTCFVAAKAPLDPAVYAAHVGGRRHEFTPTTLMEECLLKKWRVGLVIDATMDSSHYYCDDAEWDEWDVPCYKLPTAAATTAAVSAGGGGGGKSMHRHHVPTIRGRRSVMPWSWLVVTAATWMTNVFVCAQEEPRRWTRLVGMCRAGATCKWCLHGHRNCSRSVWTASWRVKRCGWRCRVRVRDFVCCVFRPRDQNNQLRLRPSD